MDAIKQDHTMEIYLSVQEDSYTQKYRDFRTMDTETLQAMAEGFAVSFGEPDYYDTGVYRYMVFRYTAPNLYHENPEFIRYKTFKDGKHWNILAMKTDGKKFSASEEDMIQNIAALLEIDP